MRDLEDYHYIWLSSHPERTEKWLRSQLADGFHIHHVDGDHANNDSKNLVMIEAGDHMMLHNGATRLSWLRQSGVKGSRGKQKRTLLREEVAMLQKALARQIYRDNC